MTDSATKTATNAVHLTTADFDEKIKAAGTPAFVDFYAVWCGPCQQAAPIVEELAGEYAGKVFVAKVDTDESPELAERFGIRSIPTTIVLKPEGGELKEADRTIGFGGRDKFVQMLKKASAA